MSEEPAILQFRQPTIPFRKTPYTPGYVVFPEARPKRRPISAFFSFWIGFSFGAAAIGSIIPLVMK